MSPFRFSASRVLPLVLGVGFALLFAGCGSTPVGGVTSTAKTDGSANNVEDIVTGANDVTAVTDSGPKPDTGVCTCAPDQCGITAGCTTDCGACKGDFKCSLNQCVGDPKCKCGVDACDILPGCKASCGDCGGKSACENNKCKLSCSCSGIECGVPPSCTKSCGDCGAGQVCNLNQCAADPKCACGKGTCGTPPGCADNCGSCTGGQVCKDNKCNSTFDCNCQGIVCGFPSTACSKSCGSCSGGGICELNICIKASDALKKFGEPCGPNGGTETKPPCLPCPPDSPAKCLKDYVACLSKQCDTYQCDKGTCTKPCKIAVDQVNNVTGDPGADGIEDPGANSDCASALDGVNGKKFSCIEQYGKIQTDQGQHDQICAPGSGFKPCKANGDCINGEVCRLYTFLGTLTTRCGPAVHNPNGSAANAGGLNCLENPDEGTLALCLNNRCTENGCVDFCKNDADCKVAAGACKAGKCQVTGKGCAIDDDCKWSCKPQQAIDPTSPALFDICMPPA